MGTIRKKLKRIVTVVIVVMCFLSFNSVSIYAAYAYSIGTDHGNSIINLIFDQLDGDFTDNVLYASTCYGTINNITSHYNLKPTVDYMRGTNPNGNRRIASRIVFLNGHANYDCIVFAHNNESGYKTGVHMYEDQTSSNTGFAYAGLTSTDMSTCKIISFVGCCTGGNISGDNLIKLAVRRGAKTAVGFREEITSRTSDGKGWLRKYNDAIATGMSVSQSIRSAVDSYPNLNMSKCVSISGRPVTAISNINADMNSSKINVSGIQNMEDVNADEFENKMVLNVVKAYDNTFEPEDYEVTVNMFDEVNGDGVIIFCYVIDDTIETNKAYICHVENNVITEIKTTQNEKATTIENSIVAILNNIVPINTVNSDIFKSVSIKEMEKSVNEDELMELVEQHKNNNVKSTNEISETSDINIKSTDMRYYYDYFTGKLTYEKVNYVFVDNVIVDNYTGEELN